jgi:sterol desaturase/sphingolipid hydroxylase (fatty acid hydroxylase superfamily)
MSVVSVSPAHVPVLALDLKSKFKAAILKIWSFNITDELFLKNKFTLYSALVFGFIVWLFSTPKIEFFMDPIVTGSVHMFHMAPELDLAKQAPFIAKALLAIALFRFLFLIGVGVADIVFHKKVTGKPFAWRGMINTSLANIMMWGFGFLFIGFSPSFEQFMNKYVQWLNEVPHIIDINGPLAVILACLIGDFCFYWSHRLTHNMRLLWNLGHINHHRHENLTQFHFAAEPDVLALKASKGVALFMLPFLSALFTTDFSGAGWFLVVMLVIDIWIDPSHSPALYRLEQKYKFFRSLRLVFVTVGVHYTHHSKEPRHNKKTGCNFAARFTIWDRIFGTYVEPDEKIPETGLFGSHVDYCYNPIRFLLLPYVRFYRELKLNAYKHWPKILFGSVFYSPPVKAKMSH